mgnify:CR=1 FL=1
MTTYDCFLISTVPLNDRSMLALVTALGTLLPYPSVSLVANQF